MYTWLKISTITKYVFWGYFGYLKSVRGWSAVPFCTIYHNLKCKSHLSLGLCAILNCPAIPGNLRLLFYPVLTRQVIDSLDHSCTTCWLLWFPAPGMMSSTYCTFLEVLHVRFSGRSRNKWHDLQLSMGEHPKLKKATSITWKLSGCLMGIYNPMEKKKWNYTMEWNN